MTRPAKIYLRVQSVRFIGDGHKFASSNIARGAIFDDTGGRDAVEGIHPVGNNAAWMCNANGMRFRRAGIYRDRRR